MTAPTWTLINKTSAVWTNVTKPFSAASWGNSQKNIVNANVLFNQVGIIFNQLGKQFGGIMNISWSLTNKNT